MAESGNAENDEKEYKKALLKMYKEAQREQQIRAILRQYLEPEAYERAMNISVSNSDLYMQIANLIVSLIQSNQVSGRITDQQFVSLLNRLTYKKEPKIEFKHK